MPHKEKMDDVLAVMICDVLMAPHHNPNPNPKTNTTFPKNKFDWGGLFTRVPRDGAVIPRHAFSQRLGRQIFRVVVDQVKVHRSYGQPAARDVMAFLGFFFRRQLSPSVYHFARITKSFRPPTPGAPLRRLHGSSRLRVTEKGPWGKSRGPEQQYQPTDLDKADALVGLHGELSSVARVPFTPTLLSFAFPLYTTATTQFIPEIATLSKVVDRC